MLRCENVSFAYEKNKRFIENLDLNIPKGKITTILGPNGSGKSTLLSLLCCYNKPSNGCIYLDDTNLSKLKTTNMLFFFT